MNTPVICHRCHNPIAPDDAYADTRAVPASDPPRWRRVHLWCPTPLAAGDAAAVAVLARAGLPASLWTVVRTGNDPDVDAVLEAASHAASAAALNARMVAVASQ